MLVVSKTRQKTHSLSAVTMLAQSMNRGPTPVSLQSSICIPGKSEVVVECQLPRSSQDQLGMISPFSAPENSSIPSHILLAYSVCQANSRSVPVRIMNTSNFDIDLHVGQKVGEFCPLVEVPAVDYSAYPTSSSHCCSTTTVSEDLIFDLQKALSPELSSPERKEILATLMKFADVFQEDLGHTDVISHRIDTGDAPPIRQYPHHLPYSFREEVRSQVTDMLQKGVIQPSSSPWASPIVLVKKRMEVIVFVLTIAN